MITTTFFREEGISTLKVFHETISLETQACMQFVDITDLVAEVVWGSRIQYGIVNVQTQHTTTAILINEYEPLLLEDVKRVLEELAPQAAEYQHNNFAIRTVNMSPEEDPNGHSHCKAILLRTSETLNVVEGVIQLGRWQRVFFVECDKAKPRTVSVMVMGSEA